LQTKCEAKSKERSLLFQNCKRYLQRKEASEQGGEGAEERFQVDMKVGKRIRGSKKISTIDKHVQTPSLKL